MLCLLIMGFIAIVALVIMLISMSYGFFNAGEGHNYKPWEVRKLMFGDGDYVHPSMEPNQKVTDKSSFSTEPTQVNKVVNDGTT